MRMCILCVQKRKEGVEGVSFSEKKTHDTGWIFLYLGFRHLEFQPYLAGRMGGGGGFV